MGELINSELLKRINTLTHFLNILILFFKNTVANNMKILIVKNTVLILLIGFSMGIKAQNIAKKDIRETELLYSENYTPPLNIEFVFDGDSEYRRNFYSDLE